MKMVCGSSKKYRLLDEFSFFFLFIGGIHFSIVCCKYTKLYIHRLKIQKKFKNG